tara:strand:- start:19 stop:753 length:735 start_codon:yes stop_codon:yes gene_type:complete
LFKLNSFVSLKFNKEDISSSDIGKLKYFDDEQFIISFFENPDQEPIEKVFNFKEDVSNEEFMESILEEVELTKHTRIYYFNHEDEKWYAGFVNSQDLNSVECVFTDNILPTQYYPNKDVYIRLNKPVSDPSTFLKKYISENKYLSDKREKYAKFMIDQRAISFGISSILSSIIDLTEYQIQIVSRILKDPIQRYLLSDEVGLGKTIEAGIILKQFVNDFPLQFQCWWCYNYCFVIVWKIINKLF